MISEIWKHKKEILAGITNTLIKDKFVEEIAAERMSVCNQCSEKKTDGCAALIKACCKICGCSLEFKTRSLASHCPVHKWPALEE
jgi:hypothetical protein